jgi:hypothetical protein
MTYTVSWVVTPQGEHTPYPKQYEFADIEMARETLKSIAAAAPPTTDHDYVQLTAPNGSVVRRLRANFWEHGKPGYWEAN